MDAQELTYFPEIYNPQQPDDWGKILHLRERSDITCVDALPEAIEDLFRIDFPYIAPGSPEFAPTYQTYIETVWAGQELDRQGVWVFLPWRNHLIHLPNAEDFHKLRTSRNKFLITEEEQDAFYNAHIGLAGLSVGSSVLNSITLSGGGRNFRIADFDTLSITNLNRLFGSVCDLATSKGIAACRRIYEINPFANLQLFDQGLSDDNLDEFFSGPHKLDLFIEEMDSIRLKIVSRYKARQLGIPVIMATDNGDNTIIDVERFDLDPHYPLFHGRANEQQLAQAADHLTLSEKVRLANNIVGPDVTPRMQYSLTMTGQQLPAWPQLGNAATLSGAAISYVARRILTGQPMPSGRYEVNFDTNLDVDYHTPEAIADREEKKQEFIESFNLMYGEEE